jgi:outer membrane protein assembly factor BamB
MGSEILNATREGRPLRRVARASHRAAGRAALLAVALGAAASMARGADWPTYRADASRSGYTAEALPQDLSRGWSYRSRQAPQPAWSGRDTRMSFDRVFQPVSAAGRLFFGSSADGKVYALDAATGAVCWSFFTGAPVRFAPALWQDRVFAVSDDGFLYCLAAVDGALLWKRRGGPQDSMILGNERLISRWPARGGPALADGVVYWAAGIWPAEGIYVYAVDATTGKVVWCNDSAGGLAMPQPHPGAFARSGISAQGDLVVSGDALLVPTGRAVAAALNRTDGTFRYFHLQEFRADGGAGVVAIGADVLSRGSAFDLATGRQARQAAVSPETCAVTPTQLIYATATAIVAIDRAALWKRTESVDRLGQKQIQTVLSEPVWQVPSAVAPSALLVAGDELVIGGVNAITVLDIKTRTVRFTAAVDGVAAGLAVADGRLFVSTDQGSITCFGAASAPLSQAAAPPSAATEYGSDERVAQAAAAILQRTGITAGYCLDLGCGDGALAYELARRTELRIYAVDRDPAAVATARQRLAAAGLYGTRVTVHEGNPEQTGYPDYFANLIVSCRSLTDGPAAAPAAEVARLLRPYGGVSCLGKPGEFQTTTRGKLEGAGEWTHQYCDPANTNCSTDTLVEGPLGVLWFADWNFQMPSRHGRGPAPLYREGRLFVEGVNGLLCVDAYNGRPLWQVPLPDILKVYDGEHLMGASGTGSNLCLGAGGLYVRTGSTCLRLDPATGRQLAQFNAPNQPDGTPGSWGLLACVGNTLLGTLADTQHLVTYRYGKGDMRTQWTESTLLFAMDAESGAVRWTWKPAKSIRHNAVAAGGGKVFLIDRDVALGDRTLEARRGVSDPGATHPPGALVALNLADGALAWQSSEAVAYGTLLAFSQEHDTLLMCYQKGAFKLASEQGGRMAAFEASSGTRRWDIKAAYQSRPILNGRTIYLQPGAWDLLTGAALDFTLGRSYGCGIPSGSRNLLLFRSATLGYVDLASPHGTENYGGIRPGCWINTLPVGGLVLMPDATDRCTCSYLIKASVALQRRGVRPPALTPAVGP